MGRRSAPIVTRWRWPPSSPVRPTVPTAQVHPRGGSTVPTAIVPAAAATATTTAVPSIEVDALGRQRRALLLQLLHKLLLTD